MIPGLVIAGIVLLLVILFFVMRKTGSCPACGKTIGFLPGVTCCPHCGAYGYSAAGKLLPVEEGYIASFPKFCVPLSQLKPPGEWRWPWADTCCLCNASAASHGKVDVTIQTGALGLGSVREFTRRRFQVGYCAQHKGGEPGIDFGLAGVGEECMQFRSYDSWLTFKVLNETPRGTGGNS